VKVLLTGSEGYIGSVLGPRLVRRGHAVVGVDTGFHRTGWLVNTVDGAPAWINKDTRKVERADLDGFDAVVHLADLSNDPVGELNPDVTVDINYRGTVRLAELARSAGVERFVYMSSCSIYGAAGDVDSTEEAPVAPQTEYARCKVRVERGLRALAGDGFSPTYLRNATAFGLSPRMRFDLVVNNLAGHAWTDRVIRMESDGTPWRPFVHINDISDAIACVLEAPVEVVHDQAFNVGDNAQNYQIRQIAEIISSTFPGCELTVGDSSADKRNYRANFDKINSQLPGFRCQVDVEKGARELLHAFRAIELTKAQFEARGHTRIKQIRYLLDTGQIDDYFYWKSLNGS
jgi:nucleoside-diphosphate-sugar epimerase